MDVLELFKSILAGDTVVVGVSGGPDSTALLDALFEFSRKVPCKIIVAHVNHGIRGAAAAHDENFVKNLAKQYGLKFEIKRVKLAGKTHLEELGREVRHEFFEKLRAKYKAKWILTAHTQNDQIETMVFNFLRGSGPRGLSGMDVAWGAYLKPLLGVPKSEILKYLKSKNLKFCTDATNNDTNLSRNFIRKKIMPLFEKLNPSFATTILRNAKIFKGIDEWLQKEADAFLKNGTSFVAKDFLKLPESLQQAVIQAAYQTKTGYAYQLPITKIDEILRMIKRNIGKKKIITGKPAATFYLYKGEVDVG